MVSPNYFLGKSFVCNCRCSIIAARCMRDPYITAHPCFRGCAANALEFRSWAGRKKRGGKKHDTDGCSDPYTRLYVTMAMPQSTNSAFEPAATHSHSPPASSPPPPPLLSNFIGMSGTEVNPESSSKEAYLQRSCSTYVSASTAQFLSKSNTESHVSSSNKEAVHLQRSSSMQFPKRRTKSLIEDPTPTCASSRAPVMFIEDAIRELWDTKGQNLRPRGRPLNIFASLFSCLHPRRLPQNQASIANQEAQLFETRQRHQSASRVAERPDVLEWQLEQLKAFIAEKEKGHSQHQEGLFPQSGLGRKNRTFSAAGEGFGISESSGKVTGGQIVRDTAEKYGKVHIPKDHVPQDEVEAHEEKVSLALEESTRAELSWEQESQNLATAMLFEMATVKARLAIRSFCKVWMKQIEASGYGVLSTLSELLEPGVRVGRKEHAAYMLESKINNAFFHYFESDSFDESGIMQILDPAARCMARLEEFQKLKVVDVDDAVDPNHLCFDPDFRRFCEQKTREMWSQFSWNIIFNNREERDSFTTAFLDAAKSVWLMHRLAFSMNPPVSILRVGKGMEINSLYVEAVPSFSEGGCSKCLKPKIEFMIMPGFRANKKVIRCQIYRHVQC